MEDFVEKIFNFNVTDTINLGEAVHHIVPADWPVTASIYYYVFTCMLATILRSFTKTILPKSIGIYFLDLITTLQVCACSLENANVRYYCGLTGYLLAVFGLGLFYSYTFKEYSGNPLSNVIIYLRNGQSLKRTLLRIAFQTAGGVMAYRYAMTVWALKINFAQFKRTSMPCTNDLSVDPWMGFSVEFAGTMFETFLTLCRFTNYTGAETLCKMSISLFNLTFGVGYTGYYLNPVNATTQTFGCAGSNKLIFLLVYWLGPIVATIGAVNLHKKFAHNSKDTAVYGKHRRHRYRKEKHANNTWSQECEEGYVFINKSD